MITIYTALYTYEVPKDIKFDVYCPENNKSPYEQIEWINNNWDKNITVFTFSHFIVNQLNALIAMGKLNRDNLAVWMCVDADDGSSHKLSLYATAEDGDEFIDVNDFSDVIREQFNMYRHYITKTNNEN